MHMHMLDYVHGGQYLHVMGRRHLKSHKAHPHTLTMDNFVKEKATYIRLSRVISI